MNVTVPNSSWWPPEWFFIKMGSDENHFNVLYVVRSTVTKTMSVNHNCWISYATLGCARLRLCIVTECFFTPTMWFSCCLSAKYLGRTFTRELERARRRVQPAPISFLHTHTHTHTVTYTACKHHRRIQRATDIIIIGDPPSRPGCCLTG